MEVFLRFIADTSDTVIREVRIKGSASLLQLHEQVYATFGLEPGEMGSFYYSTADWDQGEELPMFSIDDSSPSMETMTVADFFSQTAHALYVYNFLDMNIFYVEKVKEDEEEGFEDFVVLNAVGELDKKPTKPSADAAPGIAMDPSKMTECPSISTRNDKTTNLFHAIHAQEGTLKQLLLLNWECLVCRFPKLFFDESDST